MVMKKVTFSLTDGQISQLFQLKRYLGSSSTAEVIRWLITDSWEKRIYKKR